MKLAREFKHRFEVPASGGDNAAGHPGIQDGLALHEQRFASHGQVVCDPMVQGRSGVVSAALDLGCAFIGADDDQSHIDLVLEQLDAAAPESQPPDREDA